MFISRKWKDWGVRVNLSKPCHIVFSMMRLNTMGKLFLGEPEYDKYGGLDVLVHLVFGVTDLNPSNFLQRRHFDFMLVVNKKRVKDGDQLGNIFTFPLEPQEFAVERMMKMRDNSSDAWKAYLKRKYIEYVNLLLKRDESRSLEKRQGKVNQGI